MKLQLDDSVSNSSQYPSGAGGVPAADGEGNNQQVEKKMRTSLLSNLKKRFEAESGGSQQTQCSTSPVKAEKP